MASRQFSPVWAAYFGLPVSEPSPSPAPPEAKAATPQTPAWDRLLWQLRLLASEQPEEVRDEFIVDLGEALRLATRARGDQDWSLDQPKGRAGLDGEELCPLSTGHLCNEFQRELQAACATLAAPARQLCRTARNARLALHSARLGQLVRELAQPHRQMQPAGEVRRAMAGLRAWLLNGEFRPAMTADGQTAAGYSAA